MSTSTSSQRDTLLNCSASAIPTEISASTTTTVASISIAPNNPVINDASVTDVDLLYSDSEVDDTIRKDITDEDYEEISGSATMRKSVFNAKSMSFADWEFLDAQRCLKTFMSRANTERRRKLMKWFLDFYKTFELKGAASANAIADADSRALCSPMDTNEIEISMASETVLNDPNSQLARTMVEATPPALQPFPHGPTDNLVSEVLMDDTDSDFYVKDFIRYEVSGSDPGETNFYEDNNTRTIVIDISETTPHPPQSDVQGSKCVIVSRSPWAKSRNTRCQNVPLETTKHARRQRESPVTSKPKTDTAKAKLNWYSCSHFFCNFKTRGLYQLKIHLGKVHFDTPFKCGKCGWKYRLPGSLSNHLNSHKEEKHVCPFQNCSYKSAFSSRLKEHMMMHRGDKPLACKECDYKASRSSHLKEHMRTHTGEKPFACTQCKYRSARNRNLIRHVHDRHGVKK